MKKTGIFLALLMSCMTTACYPQSSFTGTIPPYALGSAFATDPNGNKTPVSQISSSGFFSLSVKSNTPYTISIVPVPASPYLGFTISSSSPINGNLDLTTALNSAMPPPNPTSFPALQVTTKFVQINGVQYLWPLSNASGCLFDDGSGTLTFVACSGTGLTNPMTTAADMIVGGVSGVPARLAKGADGTVLTMAGGIQTWAAPTGGISSIGLTMPLWLAVSGSPLTSNGTLAVSAATGQTSHQVIGTCGTATSFGPCSLVAADIPALGYLLPNGSSAALSQATTSAFGVVKPDGTTITISGGVISAVGGGGGSSAFSAITGGTNTTAAMLVGTGSSLGVTGSGTIAATSVPLGGVSGLGTGIATFLATPSSANLAAALTDETGTGAAVFANGGTLVAPLLGTPASGVITNLTGTCTSCNATTAATLTTGRTIAGTTFNGSANISLANKFIVQGTADAGLSGPQFLGALGTGLVKNTTVTGVLSIANAGTDYLLPTGSSAGLSQATTGAFGVVKPDGTTITISGGVISAVGGGSGTVTHSAGALTALACVLGNGSADIKIDSVCVSDGAGNYTFASITTNSVSSPSQVVYTANAVAPAVVAGSAGWGVAATLGTAGTYLMPNAPGNGLWTASNASGIVTNTFTAMGTGIATFLTTPSSANLLAAITDETGTGVLVANTSPSLVTPTLGVASATSVTLTAATAGFYAFGQGSTSAAVAPCSAANTECFMAPASIATSFFRIWAGAAATGFSLWTNSSGTMTETLVGSTGSGNVVLATSATLVTPDLGTPSAGVLTNATGLPLTTGITGTLAGTNGGTGVNNSTRTITYAGNLTFAGGFTQSYTATANSSVTIPTSGTLSNATVKACGTTTTCSNTTQNLPIIVQGSVALTGGTATVTALPTFTSTTSFGCTASDNTSIVTGAHAAPASVNSITVTGTGTDNISYICVGN